MALAVLFSVFIFLGQSVRLDESQSLWQTSHGLVSMFQLIGADVHVPLYHVLLHFWELFLGNSIPVARLLSLLFFVLSIPALYLVGQELYGPRVALYATLLFSLSPFMNWYGNEIRMYSLFTLLAIVNQYCFLRIFREKEGYDRNAWFGYLVTCILGTYTHYFFSLLILGQIVFVATHPRFYSRAQIKRFVKTGVIVFVLFIPWIVTVLSIHNAQNQAPQLPEPTSIDVANVFTQFLFGFQGVQVDTIIIALWPLSILLGFWALQKHRSISTETVYLVLSVIVPITVAFVVSVLIRPLFLSRYLVLALPATYLLVSWIFSIYPPRMSAVFRVGLVCVMAGMLVIQTVSAHTPVKEDYLGATNYITAHGGADDAVAVTAPFTIYPVVYYYRGPANIQTIPAWDRTKSGPIPAYSDANLAKQFNDMQTKYHAVWVLFSYDQGYEQKVMLYLDTHFAVMEQKSFPNGLVLKEYRLRYDVPDRNSNSVRQ